LAGLRLTQGRTAEAPTAVVKLLLRCEYLWAVVTTHKDNESAAEDEDRDAGNMTGELHLLESRMVVVRGKDMNSVPEVVEGEAEEGGGTSALGKCRWAFGVGYHFWRGRVPSARRDPGAGLLVAASEDAKASGSHATDQAAVVPDGNGPVRSKAA
jgi:hypothetical protein